MKVIHLISGGDTGGARTHVYSLLKYLGQIIDVQLVCFRGGDFADGAAALGIPTMVLGKGFLAKLGALKRIIRDGEYDIVHCHGSMANVMGAMLRPSVHVPVISTVHSDYRLDYLGRPFARAVYGTLNTWALHQLDYRVCVFVPIRQLLIYRGVEPNRLFSIYNGLDFSHVVPKTDRAAYFAQFGYTVQEGDVIAGIAARLDPVKDIPTLLRAVALAKKACPQLRLAIAGDGKERKKLEALTKELDLEDSVFFLGWVTDLDSFYGALDINTLSSVSEAFPYALPEGARAHLATVASNVGGVPAIIEHGVTGLLIEPGDVRMLAAYLARYALDANSRRAMGAALEAPEAIAILHKQALPGAIEPSAPLYAYIVPISCKDGTGFDLLEQAFDMLFPDDTPCDGSLLTNARQAGAILRAKKSVDSAVQSLRAGMTPDAVLGDLEAAMDALGEVTGRTMREDITNRIFERFCVGK